MPNAKAEHGRDSASASTPIEVGEKPLSCNKVQYKWTDAVKQGKQKPEISKAHAQWVDVSSLWTEESNRKEQSNVSKALRSDSKSTLHRQKNENTGYTQLGCGAVQDPAQPV